MNVRPEAIRIFEKERDGIAIRFQAVGGQRVDEGSEHPTQRRSPARTVKIRPQQGGEFVSVLRPAGHAEVGQQRDGFMPVNRGRQPVIEDLWRT